MSWERDCKCSDCKQAQQYGVKPREVKNTMIKTELRPISQLREEYTQAASDAAAASADISLYEAKANKARAKYEEAKARRDALKRQIAEHPEA